MRPVFLQFVFHVTRLLFFLLQEWVHDLRIWKKNKDFYLFFYRSIKQYWWLFQGFSLSTTILKRVLGDNKVLRSLTLDCTQLEDSSIEVFAKEHLEEIVLLKCLMFSSYIFIAIGMKCHYLRYVSYSSRPFPTWLICRHFFLKL